MQSKSNDSVKHRDYSSEQATRTSIQEQFLESANADAAAPSAPQNDIRSNFKRQEDGACLHRACDDLHNGKDHFSYAGATDGDNDNDNENDDDDDDKNNTDSNNIEIIENYTKKLKELQHQLSGSVASTQHCVDTASMSLDSATQLQRNSASGATTSDKKSPYKIKYKNLFQFRKDTIMRKLLKTIDLMNQEMNKRDLLIHSLEKENFLLKKNKSDEHSNTHGGLVGQTTTNLNVNEHTHWVAEISRLEQHTRRLQEEKDALSRKNNSLEMQLNDAVRDDESTVYADFRSECVCVNQPPPSSVATGSDSSPTQAKRETGTIPDQAVEASVILRLREENSELSHLNVILRNELDIWTKKIFLLEKEKSLEVEIEKRFQVTFNQKLALEQENKLLTIRLELTREDSKKQIAHFEETKKRLEHQMRLLEEKLTEVKKSSETQAHEVNMNMNKLNDERLMLVNTLSTIQLEKEKLAETLAKETHQSERRASSLGREVEKQKASVDLLNQLNFDQQKQIQQLLADLEDKKSSAQKQSSRRDDDLKRLRQSLALSAEKLRYVQLKSGSELDELRKRLGKEIDQLKFAGEQAAGRNGELSRANAELRKRVNALDAERRDATDRASSLKHQCELLARQKREQRDEHERTCAENERACLALRAELQTVGKERDDALRTGTHQQQQLVALERMRDEIDKLKREIDTHVQQNAALTDRVAKSTAACDSYRRKYAEIKAYLKKALLEEQRLKLLWQKQQQQQQQQHSEYLAQVQLSSQVSLINNLIRDLNLDIKLDSEKASGDNRLPHLLKETL